eukprot:CAMPEP_0184347674 /NCGR_PEP_ID=MMETSP1089-20130417/20239_1 /TAXON_ID=38269 ORGANISM="Gloeochaete wittrockiana, Strain SAG46.84" /NCGR_SAMPLE_ID=MMETSP1089 /ASSEMBLY_ACC=CAM_ASM_000445 /LENGTH=73 /DNA_ID=CAMNT_0026678899 /DNA_START=24 /DNA_END=242 /DNA_ORIENTATION=+
MADKIAELVEALGNDHNDEKLKTVQLAILQELREIRIDLGQERLKSKEQERQLEEVTKERDQLAVQNEKLNYR